MEVASSWELIKMVAALLVPPLLAGIGGYFELRSRVKTNEASIEGLRERVRTIEQSAIELRTRLEDVTSELAKDITYMRESLARIEGAMGIKK